MKNQVRLSTVLILAFALCAPAQAHQTFGHDSCDNLDVLTGGDLWVESWNCSHGSGEEIRTRVVEGPPVREGVKLRSSSFYGPDCTVTISSNDGTKCVIQAQQNYCFMEAGGITVRSLDGHRITYHSDEGSFRERLQGSVMVTECRQ
jgi:hypothetical protein